MIVKQQFKKAAPSINISSFDDKRAVAMSLPINRRVGIGERILKSEKGRRLLLWIIKIRSKGMDRPNKN